MHSKRFLKNAAITIFVGLGFLSFQPEAIAEPSGNLEKLVEICLKKGNIEKGKSKFLSMIKNIDENTERRLYFAVNYSEYSEGRVIVYRADIVNEIWKSGKEKIEVEQIIITDGENSSFDGISDTFDNVRIEYEGYGRGMQIFNIIRKEKPSEKIQQSLFDFYINEILSEYGKN